MIYTSCSAFRALPYKRFWNFWLFSYLLLLVVGVLQQLSFSLALQQPRQQHIFAATSSLQHRPKLHYFENRFLLPPLPSALMSDATTASTTNHDDDDNICEELNQLSAEEVALLPQGCRKGFAVLHHHAFPIQSTFDWSALGLSDKDVKRLNLTSTDISLPVAVMLMNPSKYTTLSRARKFVRCGRIVLHRGPLGMDDQGEQTVFDQEKSCMGKAKDRVYPGGKFFLFFFDDMYLEIEMEKVIYSISLLHLFLQM